jgi:hypothetical protein
MSAAPAKPGFFNGLFGKKSPPVNSTPVNIGKRSAGNTSSNEAIAEAVGQSEINAAKATPSWLPTFLGGRTKEYGKMKYAHLEKAMQPDNAATFAARHAAYAAAANATEANATGINESAVAALNASLNGKPANGGAAAKRARTRKQRGGALRVPGPRNVLRVTGKTVRKLRNVGVYGLKKVGNGVHMVTGLLGAGTKLVGSVVRKGGKTLKSIVKRRQQTRRRS